MAGRITCGLWIVVFLAGCGRLSAFNLDTENVQRKDGDPGSLFGFSLAMHEQVAPQPKKMLLVGAPRAKAWPGQKAKVIGGLYTCDMASTSTSCTRVEFDKSEDTKKESKENQWMGVSVSSQGPAGKVMVCAHRWQRRNNVNSNRESRDIIGRCVVMSQSLTIDSSSGEEGEYWHFCDSRARGHEMFGSCQQGISATFDKDYHYLIFGAPGAYNWKGIVRLEQRNETLENQGIFDDGPFEAGDETKFNPDLVPVPASSYLGFSLDSGFNLITSSLTVVAGAPRANHSGAVVMLTPGQDSKALLHQHTIDGEGLASSFGYDVTVLDLNADGWNDIVVGAPQYFEKDGDIGGAVYVYVNKEGKWNEIKPTRIDGDKDSMFGLVVENLGDINQDGFHDFAVGAPYEDNGAGKVYIYHGAGSAMGIISKKASQVLQGEPSVKMFGYSLAGNMDLDKNSYPDLAVGSLSDSVFVYKSRPVINIKKEITFTPKEIDFTKKNCGDNFCLEVKACFTYDASPADYAPKLAVAYSIVADGDNKARGLIPRATFLKTADRNHESKGVITIDRKGEKQCIDQKLVIPENIKDKLNGIPIDVSVDIQESKRKRRQSSSELAPVLDANEEKITRKMVSFLKEGCGADDACQSNLQVEYRYGYKTTEDDTFKPLSLEGGLPVISLSKQEDIALEVKVSNLNADDAYEAALIVSFPKSLTYSAFRPSPNAQQVNCKATVDGSVLDCDLANPFKQNIETTFYIIMGTSRITHNITEVEIDLQMNTTSTQILAPVKAKAKVSVTLQLTVSGLAQPSQVMFSGDVKGETGMKTESDIGSAITHVFRIINLGKSLKDLGTATLEIEWPKETADGKWLLYLMKISSTGVDQMKCTPETVVNPLKKEATSTRIKRAAGNAETPDDGTISLLTDKKSETLSCSSGARCVKIKCPLGGMDSNADITLSSRLWNSTFIEDYSKHHHVDVIVKATLHVDSQIKNTVVQNADTQVKLTVYPERRSAKYGGGVPWWIIVLSILFGLMLLALLAFLLWKCGLFGKKNKEPSDKERLTA